MNIFATVFLCLELLLFAFCSRLMSSAEAVVLVDDEPANQCGAEKVHHFGATGRLALSSDARADTIATMLAALDRIRKNI